MTAGDIIVAHESGAGKKGNYYDGTDDYVLHDAHAVARVAAADTIGTYTAWIFLDNIAGTYAILSAGDHDNTNEYLYFRSAAGKLRVRINHAGATKFDVSETTGSLQARRWTHVAVVQNGTRPTLYVDGKAVAMTDTTSTDLTCWYGTLTLCDKFAIGVLESNNTHTVDFHGAIGQVKYWNLALTQDEIQRDIRGEALISLDGPRQTLLTAGLYFNVTYDYDGTTDSGLGADNGTLTGGAIYGGEISPWSYKINENVTGHAAEYINTVIDGTKFLSIIKRGD